MNKSFWRVLARTITSFFFLALPSVVVGLPMLSVVDSGINTSGNREWSVQVDPDATLFSSGANVVAAELAFEVSHGLPGALTPGGGLVSATANMPGATLITGANPFTSMMSTGVSPNLTTGTVFAALQTPTLTIAAPFELMKIETHPHSWVAWGGPSTLWSVPPTYTGSTLIQGTAQSTGIDGTAAACDATSDGVCNQDDVERLFDAIWTSPAGSPFDLDGSGVVDLDDSRYWLKLASNPYNPYKATRSKVYVMGDLTLDGMVDSADLGLPLNTCGMLPMYRSCGNANADSFINSADVGLVLNDFGRTSVSAAAVPEPGGGALVLLAWICGAIGLRSRR